MDNFNEMKKDLPDDCDYALNIKTVQGGTFKTLIEALKEIIIDTVFIFNEKGIELTTMDPSHIGLVHLRLDASKFEHYECHGEHLLGINLLNLNAIIKQINNNDTLSLSMLNSNKNELQIKFENIEKNIIRVSQLNLLDLDNTNIQDIPPITVKFTVQFPSSQFQKVCRDIVNLSDTVEITMSDNQFILACKGDFCNHKIIINNDSEATEMLTETENSGIYKGTFDAKYLFKFTKFTNLSNMMMMHMNNDSPLYVLYDVGNLGKIKLCMAPQQDDL